MPVAWLFPPRSNSARPADLDDSGGYVPKGLPAEAKCSARYVYRNQDGSVAFRVNRWEWTAHGKREKSFRQERPDGRGGWIGSTKNVGKVPYRLPELVSADPEATVFIVEGEKDADRLVSLGLVASTSAQGAGQWQPDFSPHFEGRHIVILQDNDDAGRKYAADVLGSLAAHAASIKVIELPGLPTKGDVSDWLDSGGTRDELMRLVADAPEAAGANAQWGELVPFDATDLPEFPVEVLPVSLREWVTAESEATQTPPDLAALLALAVCASGIARRVVVSPRPGWDEPTNLFVAVLLQPANRKSAVLADAIKPLREVERELIEAAAPSVARAKSERRQAEGRLKKLEKQAGELEGEKGIKAAAEAAELAEALATEPVAVLPRLLTDDSTGEKLAIMLSDQGGRLASMSPEGGVFDLMAGKYAKGGHPQFGEYLKGHAGDDLIVDRVGRDGLHVERPALTCAYAIQPAVIEGVADNPAFRGRGLLGRFLYAVPRSWIGSRKIATPPVPNSVREAFRQSVRSLLLLSGEHVLEFSPDAEVRLREWEAEVEATLAEGGALEAIPDWGGKLVGATVRLCAILHCVEHGGPVGEVEPQTLAAAVAIARYLVPHAEAVLRKMGADAAAHVSADAQYILRWIVRHERKVFTKSEAQQHGKRRFPKANDIDLPIAELVDRKYIRPRPAVAGGPGRPGSPTYEVNPAVFSTPAKRPDNSGIPVDPPDGRNSRSIQDTSGESDKPKRKRVTL
jgi:hypothetical protein